MLFPDGQNPATFIAELMVLDKYLIPGRSGGNLFQGHPNTDLLAIRLVSSKSSDYSVALPSEVLNQCEEWTTML